MKYVYEIALYWRDVGVQLLENSNMLDIIYKNNASDVEKCCREMLQCWIEVDTEANWNKLIDALEHVDLKRAAARVKRDILPGKVYYIRYAYVPSLLTPVTFITEK